MKARDKQLPVFAVLGDTASGLGKFLEKSCPRMAVLKRLISEL